jgi:hypothetical protein
MPSVQQAALRIQLTLILENKHTSDYRKAGADIEDGVSASLKTRRETR